MEFWRRRTDSSFDVAGLLWVFVTAPAATRRRLVIPISFSLQRRLLNRPRDQTFDLRTTAPGKSPSRTFAAPFRAGV